MPLTTRTHKGLLDALFGKTSVLGALASAPTLYVGVSTTAPAMDGTNATEPVGNAYARVATVAADWNTATSADPAVLTNAEAITFPQASGSWGTLTHFALYDAATSGNMVASGAFATSRAVSSGGTLSAAAGDLSIRLQSPA